VVAEQIGVPHIRATNRLHRAVEKAADNLLGVLPTTIDGASALMIYVADFEAAGNDLGGGYEDEKEICRWSLEHGVS